MKGMGVVSLILAFSACSAWAQNGENRDDTKSGRSDTQGDGDSGQGNDIILKRFKEPPEQGQNIAHKGNQDPQKKDEATVSMERDKDEVKEFDPNAPPQDAPEEIKNKKSKGATVPAHKIEVKPPAEAGKPWTITIKVKFILWIPKDDKETELHEKNTPATLLRAIELVVAAIKSEAEKAIRGREKNETETEVADRIKIRANTILQEASSETGKAGMHNYYHVAIKFYKEAKQADVTKQETWDAIVKLALFSWIWNALNTFVNLDATQRVDILKKVLGDDYQSVSKIYNNEFVPFVEKKKQEQQKK